MNDQLVTKSGQQRADERKSEKASTFIQYISQTETFIIFDEANTQYTVFRVCVCMREGVGG